MKQQLIQLMVRFCVLWRHSEADETTCVVRATPAVLVQSAAHASQTTEAEVKFKQNDGDDAEVDAAELRAILNEVFTQGQCQFSDRAA